MLDKSKIGKADGNVAKGARASRLQRNKMVKFLPLLLFFIVKANEFRIFIKMYSRSRPVSICPIPIHSLLGRDGTHLLGGQV